MLSEGNPRAALSAARQATIEGHKPGQVVAIAAGVRKRPWPA